MEYLALYRKYRPENFDEIIGQEHITKTLKNQILNNQISHAYLFCGTRGTGKTSVAKIFAKAVSCLDASNKPCNKCSSCEALSLSSNIDVLEIDAASNNGVDNIRDLKDNVKYPPVMSKYKVYIIDEVHMLSESAFNALLKTLEEPPPFVIFILATTESHKLPATILSRCVRFDFKLVTIPDLEKILTKIFKEEKIICEPAALSLMASMGEGSVRDTLSVAEKCVAFGNKKITYESVLDATGAMGKNVLFALAEQILKGNKKDFLHTLNDLVMQGKDVLRLNRELVSFFRDLAVAKTSDNAADILFYPKDILDRLTELSASINFKTLLHILQTLSALENEFRYTENPKEFFEIIALSLMSENENTDKTSTKHLSSAQPSITISNKKLNEEFYDKNVLFGKLLANLRTNKNYNAYSLLDNVEKYEIENDSFNIYLSNKTVFSKLSEKETYSIMQKEFLSISPLRLQIVLKEKSESHEKILVSNFKDILTIEE